MNGRHRELHALLASLGHASRFRIALRLLEGERSVGELAVAVGLSQSCTTRHVQALERAGVVRSRRDGKRVLVGLERAQADLAGLLDWIAPAGRTAGDDAEPVRVPARRPRAARLPRPAAGPAARTVHAESGDGQVGARAARPAAQEGAPAPASHSGKDAASVDVPDTPRRRVPDPMEDFLL